MDIERQHVQDRQSITRAAQGRWWYRIGSGSHCWIISGADEDEARAAVLRKHAYARGQRVTAWPVG